MDKGVKCDNMIFNYNFIKYINTDIKSVCVANSAQSSVSTATSSPGYNHVGRHNEDKIYYCKKMEVVKVDSCINNLENDLKE
jgi:hypothetical protein